MAVASLGWFHRYPARFAPHVVSRMIETSVRRAGQREIFIVDPFAGTGATLSAARQFGCTSLGIELSHLGVLISSVRLCPPTDLEDLVSFVDSFSRVKHRNWAYPIDTELVEWIGTVNAKFLSHFLMLLDCVEGHVERSWLELAMSAALRPSSVWLPGSIKPQRDPDREAPDLRRVLRRSARKLARDCRLEAQAGISPAAKSFILKASATNIPLATETADAVVTSPPYGSMYDYFDVQRLSYLAFRWQREDRHQIGRAKRVTADGSGFVPPTGMVWWYNRAFGGEQTIKGRALRAYLGAMEAHLEEAHRILRTGGTAAYAVANTFRNGKEFDLCGAIIELLRRVGFVDIRWNRRAGTARRILPAGRDPDTGRFSSRKGRRVDERIIYATK